MAKAGIHEGEMVRLEHRRSPVVGRRIPDVFFKSDAFFKYSAVFGRLIRIVSGRRNLMTRLRDGSMITWALKGGVTLGAHVG